MTSIKIILISILSFGLVFSAFARTPGNKPGQRNKAVRKGKVQTPVEQRKAEREVRQAVENFLNEKPSSEARPNLNLVVKDRRSIMQSIEGLLNTLYPESNMRLAKVGETVEAGMKRLADTNTVKGDVREVIANHSNVARALNQVANMLLAGTVKQQEAQTMVEFASILKNTSNMSHLNPTSAVSAEKTLLILAGRMVEALSWEAPAKESFFELLKLTTQNYKGTRNLEYSLRFALGERGYKEKQAQEARLREIDKECA